MRKLNFWQLLIVVAVAFSSCSKEDDDFAEPIPNVSEQIDTVYTEPEISYSYLFLSEGSWGYNNSSIDAITSSGKLETSVYEFVNGVKIGDTAQDMIQYGDVYVTVTGSSYLSKLSKYDLSEKERYSFTEEQGAPRYIDASNGYIYVSTYGGYVIQFDTLDIQHPKSSTFIGLHLEDLIIKDNTIYVAIAGDYNVAYDNRIGVLDVDNLSKVSYIEVQDDPTSLFIHNDILYCVHYNTSTWQQEVLSYNFNTKQTKTIGNGSKVFEFNGDVYIIDIQTDWNTGEVNSVLSTLDGKNISLPEPLGNSTIYSVDCYDNKLVVSTTDYSSNATIYELNDEFNIVNSFEVGGTNVCKSIKLKLN